MFVEEKRSGILRRARHYLPCVVMQGLYYAFICPYQVIVTLYGEIRAQQDKTNKKATKKNYSTRIISFLN